MKIWMKMLFCLAIGVALGCIVPAANQGAADMISFLALLVIRIGRAIALPLLFFSVVLALYQLHEDRLIAKGSLLPLLISLGATAVLVLFGIVSILAVNPQRINIRIDLQTTGAGFDVQGFFLKLVPENVAAVFLSSDFLLPTLLVAFILGAVLAAERANAKPSILVFDSLSRAVYHVNSYFSEFAAFGMIFLCADGILSLRRVSEPGNYAGLFLVIGIDVAVALLAIIPALLYSLGGRKNPYRWLYAFTAPALAAFFSGDVNFSYGILSKHLKESLGIRRRANSIAAATALTIGRAGSAMIGTVSFLLVYRSYSSLGLSLSLIVEVFFAALFVSLALSAAPGAGAFTAVTLLCGLLGHGYEQGYLLLKPVAWIIVAAGAMLDIVVAGAISLVVGRRLEMQEEKELRFYI